MDEVIESSNEQVAPVETSPIEGIEQKPVEDVQEKNWRELNRAKRELEKKAKMQEELIEKLLQHQQPHQPTQMQEVDELDQIPDDDYVPKGKQKKLVRKEVEPLQKRIDELEAKLKQQSQVNQFENLRRKYSDFDDIVNPETIAIFEEQEPELAQTIVDMKDPYKIGMQTYKYIKALNISDQVPKARRAREIDKKIESNKKTVPSPQAFDKRPMAQAFKLTEAEKTKLYEEMMHYASMAGSSY
ncbi:MAG TPA: hypothetical protein VNJ29_02345 [Candidatus Nitrosotenuis sp.]|nr:hypothetical protein [Candidatus Nitrosotenuis sp.]